MRKILLSLTVIAGAVAAASGSQAAGFVHPSPLLAQAAEVQTVQYYGGGGWREREWRRHERHEAWRRHQERMRWERYHHHRRW